MSTRHAQIDRKFDEFESRGDILAASRVLARVYDGRELEAIVALEECDRDEDKAVALLRSPTDRQRIRAAIATQYFPSFKAPAPKPAKEQRARRSCHGPARWERERRKAAIQSASAARDVDTSGWSQEQRQAFSRVSELPNSYFHFFPAPGEAQRHGQWDGEEDASLMREVEACGGWEVARRPDMPWGLLSRSLLGRVGFQCSNRFRVLDRQRRQAAHVPRLKPGCLAGLEPEPLPSARPPETDSESSLNPVRALHRQRRTPVHVPRRGPGRQSGSEAGFKWMPVQDCTAGAGAKRWRTGAPPPGSPGGPRLGPVHDTSHPRQHVPTDRPRESPRGRSQDLSEQQAAAHRPSHPSRRHHAPNHRPRREQAGKEDARGGASGHPSGHSSGYPSDDDAREEAAARRVGPTGSKRRRFTASHHASHEASEEQAPTVWRQRPGSVSDDHSDDQARTVRILSPAMSGCSPRAPTVRMERPGSLARPLLTAPPSVATCRPSRLIKRAMRARARSRRR